MISLIMNAVLPDLFDHLSDFVRLDWATAGGGACRQAVIIIGF